MIKTNFEKMYKPNFITIILIVGSFWDCFLPTAWGKPNASNMQQLQKQQQQSIMDPDAMFNYEDSEPQQSGQDYIDAGLIGDYSELDKDTRWQRQPSDVAAADAILAAGNDQQSLKAPNVAVASPQLENAESMNDSDFGFDDSGEQVMERSNVKQQEYQPKRAQPEKLRRGFAGRRNRQNQHQKKYELNQNDFDMEDEMDGLDVQPQKMVKIWP